MIELVRDTIFGHLLRWVSQRKFLPYPEEKDPSIRQQYIHHERPARVASHGHTGEREKDGQVSGKSSEGSSRTHVADELQASALGQQKDTEEGKAEKVIRFEPNDPEVCKSLAERHLGRS